MLKKLSVDVSSFQKMRELNYVYIDKTQYAYNLITGGHRYFLSRPRRFGKTLFVSTLSDILAGNKHLFDGLWIAGSDYQWQEYGVINLDLSSLGIKDPASLRSGLWHALVIIAQEYRVTIDTSSSEPEIILTYLVKALYAKFGRVALLIDEYDSPILHVLTDLENARAIRDALKLFFSSVKKFEKEIDFIFITGVSSFAKAGLFSGLNNLQILSLRDDVAGVCGYTELEIDTFLAPYIIQWAEKEGISYVDLRHKIKEWYNSYRFGDKVEAVYNPFSLTNAIYLKKFSNFWFASGAPTFLIDVLKKEYATFNPQKMEISDSDMGVFDVGLTPVLSLMLQTGYLTIDYYDQETEMYKLRFPNLEVKTAFQRYLLEIFARIDPFEAQRLAGRLRAALLHDDIEEVVAKLQQLFAKVPYQLHMNVEKYYHSLLIMAFSASGIKVQDEYSTDDGRVDLVLDLGNKIYLIEVKFNKSAHEALEQIKNNRYFKPFLDWNKPIVMLGLSFEREPGNFEIKYQAESLK